MFHLGATIPGKHPILEGGADTGRNTKFLEAADIEAKRATLEWAGQVRPARRGVRASGCLIAEARPLRYRLSRRPAVPRRARTMDVESRPAATALPDTALDHALAAQLAVAWAGEGGEEPRLGWWKTFMVHEDGGLALFADLTPATHRWVVFQGAREAARRADAALRSHDHDPEGLAYAPDAHTWVAYDGAAFAKVGADPSNPGAGRALELLQGAWSTFDQIDATRVQHYKVRASRAAGLSLQSIDQLSKAVIVHVVEGRDLAALETFGDAIAAVTADDLRRAHPALRYVHGHGGPGPHQRPRPPVRHPQAPVRSRRLGDRRIGHAQGGRPRRLPCAPSDHRQVRTQVADNSDRTRAEAAWLGADSNRRHCGYEPHALTN